MEPDRLLLSSAYQYAASGLRSARIGGSDLATITRIWRGILPPFNSGGVAAPKLNESNSI